MNGKPPRQFKSEWRTACKAAGLVAGRKTGGVVLYNLRHSCLTNLAAVGVPEYDGARDLGAQDGLGASPVRHHAGEREGRGARGDERGRRGGEGVTMDTTGLATCSDAV